MFQGAHLRFKEDRKTIEIIHCIALFSKDLKSCLEYAIREILEKIPELKPYGALLDNGFLHDFYTDEECQILSKMILPSNDGEIYEYEDRIAIFIGYDKEIESKLRLMQVSKFKTAIEEYIVKDIQSSLKKFEVMFESIKDVEANIDCFFVPFEDTEGFKNNFFESL